MSNIVLTDGLFRALRRVEAQKVCPPASQQYMHEDLYQLPSASDSPYYLVESGLILGEQIYLGRTEHREYPHGPYVEWAHFCTKEGRWVSGLPLIDNRYFGPCVDCEIYRCANCRTMLGGYVTGDTRCLPEMAKCLDQNPWKYPDIATINM